ncbi:uncharacterized protein KY384_003865 [Bacidia gigantensis]|uniref:uncharacterized protein n=1 Tax=Bacidia gigantensis TaxID=2732470 RepID=UPI001D04D455|nr:uncharacterized protein KY384_003865 [Bacidia gigantensis]KAG8532224.1 hypothetical protein KY384_003865 [Bacidia gigantensis]
MPISSFAFIIATLMVYVTAVPYFKPWLETRQAIGGSPTLGPYADLTYPPDHDASVCPATPVNLWANGALAAPAKASRRRRSLHHQFKIPAKGNGLHRRVAPNGTCSTIAQFTFSDWEGGADTNTPTVPIAAGVTYFFSMSANVAITSVIAWTAAPNSNHYDKLGYSQPKNKTVTMTLNPTKAVNLHFEIYFQYGHPNGLVALFSNQPPPPVAVSRRTLGPLGKKKKIYKAKESGKATHYAELLDAARCNGRWSEIPELTRKVAKHAPQRRCLVLTSQTEYRVSSFNPKRPAVASSGNTNALHEAKAVLKDASEKENEWREDAFQARVCAAWIDISLDDHQAVLAVLPQDLDTLLKALSEDGKFAQKITYVCVVRAAFFRGLALETKSRKKDAVQSYENILPYVLSVDSSVSLAPEWQCWSERLLARYCTLSSSYVSQNAHNSQDLLAEGSLFKPTAILKPYRAWSQFWDSRPAPAGGQEVSHERTLIWKGYYETLSILVRSHVAASVFDSRLQPAIELKRIEAIYQTMLLNERQFPSADEVTPEIESWADHVMRNWRTLLGSAWTNEDLRPGGSIVLGKGILDVSKPPASSANVFPQEKESRLTKQ